MSIVVPWTPTARTHRPRVATGSVVACADPACEHLAVVTDTWVWPSTAGPVAHARSRCHAGHVFTTPCDWLLLSGG